ncbi:MAG: DUF1538 domain-containing protein [Treponemataceae bacterium]|nr:DUF1538 domain-containing protein [Treponemataceae bacterium]
MPNTKRKTKLNAGQALQLIVPYAKDKLVEQIKAVSVIVIYLVLFQLIVLRLPIQQAGVITLGIVLVVIGLAFFIDGLNLGLMPLGEICGVKLPQKSKLPGILLFALILGVGATLAEPAIGVLKAAGSTVKPWDAPLLFRLLNKDSTLLVAAVGLGVGLAVMFGMLRFLYNWSLKPFIMTIIPILLAFSVFALFNKNLMHLTGLAWDCGGVTTGPVTVPLVLSLGIGISRIVGGKDGESGGCNGFGVVTLASAFPILTVYILGVVLMFSTPVPMSEVEFSKPENHEKIVKLFKNEADANAYMTKNLSEENLAVYLSSQNSSEEIASDETALSVEPESEKINVGKVILTKFKEALQAVLPLSLFLLLVLVVILREKIKHKDEMFLGLSYAIIGMMLFNLGIEFGLSKLGDQIGGNLPASFKAIAMTSEQKNIENFDKSLVYDAVNEDGTQEEFFYMKDGQKISTVTFDENQYDAEKAEYKYIPVKGPLFGKKENAFWGIFVVLLFAFLMGFSATLAEPALNTLGATVETLTVGTFKKSLLINTVAIGVGIGLSAGVAKIIWNIPLIYIIGVPYAILLVLSAISEENFVNIAWDSAGVTTGPITVPLVLAMGLGISSQVGVVEGFGILASASVFPILAVLLVGLYTNHRRKKALSGE